MGLITLAPEQHIFRLNENIFTAISPGLIRYRDP